jgi:hypothetical protein
MCELNSLKDKSEVNSFVLAVLNEHEKELSRLIAKLSQTIEKLREEEEIVERIEKAMNKLEELRIEILNISKVQF